ncbi:hypothetical protein WMY93_013688 [Mugilogobius chulae]|uniref:DUF5641 domain-containing protein n=1 Tax=Mugilogobius chulae TaxID=88201 RepID=A0AAW0PAS8_9GOBI
MLVHIFGAVSSPSCASYALRKTAQDNADFSPQVINTVLKHFYVDDCLTSAPTEKDAVQLISDLVQLCSKGGFHLTKWVSNSRLVLASIKEEARGKEIRSLDLTKDQLPTDRALGLQWKVEDDTFRFDIKVAEKPLTRRGILSMVSSMYDPLDWTKLLKAVAWYLKFGDYLLALAAKRRHATGQVSTRAALREFSSADSYTRRRWKQVQYLADVFWRRWSQEYLSTMQQRQKWFKVRRNFEVGDLVVIVDPTSPRASWPLARVLETRPDSKGLSAILFNKPAV